MPEQHDARTARWAISQSPWARDEGIAIASAVLLGLVVALIVGVVMVRATTSYNVTTNDREFEGSLYVAESGLDLALVELEKDEDYSTVPATTDLSTRAAVIAAAEALAVDPANRVATPDGEVVILKPVDLMELYTVGASPDWDTPTRNIRVLGATIDFTPWVPEYSLLVGGDLKVESKKKHKDIELLGDVHSIHANGLIEAKIKEDEGVVGCLTGWGDGTLDQKFSDGTATDCPAAADVTEVEVPDVDPMRVHYLSQYELCPDGTIRYGPANPEGFTPPVASKPEEPCTGNPVPDPESFGIKNWDKSDKKVEFEVKKSAEGIFFLYGRSAKIKTDHSVDEYYLTIIATKPYNDLDCNHVITPGGIKVDKEQYGDIEVDSHRSIRAHPDAKGYLFVTSGDLKLKLKHKLEGEAQGMVFVREQVKLELQDATDPAGSYDKGGLRGWIVAQSACDTHDSLLDKNRSEIKKGDIVFNSDYYSKEFQGAGPAFLVLDRAEI